VSFNLFFEVEPFAAILIAHGAHGHSPKFVQAKQWNSRPKAKRGEEVLGNAAASLSWSPDHRSILDALRAQKTRPVATNVVWFPFLDWIRRNPWMPLGEPLGSTEPQLKNTDVEVKYLDFYTPLLTRNAEKQQWFTIRSSELNSISSRQQHCAFSGSHCPNKQTLDPQFAARQTHLCCSQSYYGLQSACKFLRRRLSHYSIKYFLSSITRY